MNREILFRGKDSETGVWREGQYIHLHKTTYCFKEDYDQNTDNDIHQIVFEQMTDWGLPNRHLRADVDPSTVGQYTGLTDKNGKKIFEGDIVKTHYANTRNADFIEQVVFHNGKFCSLYRLSEHGKMWAELADGVPHMPQDKTPYMEWCEVIGNIFENPKLLEET